MSAATPAVLCVSSQVAAGPVGNSAMVPALLALGVTPIALPTILLSQHPGHGPPETMAIPAARLTAMLGRMEQLGFLQSLRAIVTGYLAEPVQAEALSLVIARLKFAAPHLVYICDPVIGDTDGGLYVKTEIAKAIRDVLVPIADVITPNAFELGWLTQKPVNDLESARKATAGLYGKDVVVTSIPEGADKLITAVIAKGKVTSISRPKLEHVPHGTGDLFAGLLAGYLARGLAPKDSLERSVAQVEHVIAVSAGRNELDLASGLKGLA
jgi:pyridoxine kinase